MIQHVLHKYIGFKENLSFPVITNIVPANIEILQFIILLSVKDTAKSHKNSCEGALMMGFNCIV